jgi:two-component system LytT family response regulator
VLFADDELMARRRMRRLLSAIPDVEIVAECSSGEEVLAELERTEVEVCVLDLHMGALGGLEVSEIAAELGVEIVFATAHPEHAAAAFDVGAVDYVLKPLDEERLAIAIERARKRIEGAHNEPAPVDRLALSVRGEVVLVRPEDVSHAILEEGSLVSVWAQGRAILTELSLGELEARLPHLDRVHRRALLNLALVDRLKPLSTGGYLAITTDGREVPVSRQAARALRRRLGIS